jgi:hypothetical protein
MLLCYLAEHMDTLGNQCINVNGMCTYQIALFENCKNLKL